MASTSSVMYLTVTVQAEAVDMGMVTAMDISVMAAMGVMEAGVIMEIIRTQKKEHRIKTDVSLRSKEAL